VRPSIRQVKTFSNNFVANSITLLYHQDNTVIQAKMTKAIESKADEAELISALLSLNTPEDMQAFLEDLCTPSEIRAFAERFKVARLLDQGDLSYREISEKTGASTTTVTRVARFLRDMPHKGYRRALDKLKSLK
jgi:TrpR-related protein YerC/YecD